MTDYLAWRICILCSFVLMFFQHTALAQDVKNDSIEMAQLILKAENYLTLKEDIKARETATRAFDIATYNDFVLSKGRASYIIAESYFSKTSYKESLKHFLSALSDFQSVNETGYLYITNLRLGELYLKHHLNQKALDYFEEAFTIKKKQSGDAPLFELESYIAYLHRLLNQHNQAKLHYLELIPKVKDPRKKAQLLIELSTVYEQQGNMEKCEAAIDKAIYLLRKNKLHKELTEAYNAKGFVLKRSGNVIQAKQLFIKTIELANKSPNDSATKARIYTNTGVAHTNLEEYSAAKASFFKALKLWKDIGNKREEANVLNFIAGNYFVSGNNDNAKAKAEEAIAICNEIIAHDIKSTSYKILSVVSSSKKEREEYLNTSDYYRKEHQKKTKDKEVSRLSRIAKIEKLEETLKNKIAREAEMNRYFQQMQREKETQNQKLEIQNKELQLLKQQREFQRVEFLNAELKRQKVQQLLEITQAKADAEELKKQEKEKELLLAQKEIEEKNRQAKIDSLLSYQKLQALKLEDEKRKFEYGIGIIVLIVLILLIVAYSLRITKLQGKQLKRKNTEISEQNRQIEAQSQKLTNQNELLEKQSIKIAQSISSAQLIQEAILLNQIDAKKIFPEHFVFFRPKDKISGDFYWLEQIDDIKFAAAIDCTGHGVSGAFMSLIANSLINKVVKDEKITNPSDILNRLHHHIYKELKQENTGNTDGMDMILAAIYPSKNEYVTVKCAGAKRPLHAFHKEKKVIIEINGNRMPIGGELANEKKFETQTIELPKGSYIYLASDGYIDQNDFQRKRFGSQRYKKLLAQFAHLPPPEQHAVLDRTLEKRLEKTEQRDDILVIGVGL